MKTVNLFVLIFCFSCVESVFAQNKKNVAVFLNYEYKGNIDIYNKPNGKIFGKIRNNMFQDDVVIFKIMGQNDSMFYVTAYYNDEVDSIIGWIKKTDNIGVYSRAYTQPLKLYIQPKENSKIWCIIYDYCPDMFIVTDMKNGWLKVKIEYNGKFYQGWMPPKMQCCNPYTTCS